jgi:hypothetical protein
MHTNIDSIGDNVVTLMSVNTEEISPLNGGVLSAVDGFIVLK